VGRWGGVSGTGVSAWEAEVLAALGEHLTSAEIAARLFISVRTVESHVSSLLRKLQLSDRRALAAAAGNLRPAPGQATGERAPGGTPAVDGWGAGGQASSPPAEVALLPAPLTSFVGRVGERQGRSSEDGVASWLGRGAVGSAAGSGLSRRSTCDGGEEVLTHVGFSVQAAADVAAAGDRAAADADAGAPAGGRR
jgi:DNA-binding CsgD family transcriptional regulator